MKNKLLLLLNIACLLMMFNITNTEIVGDDTDSSDINSIIDELI